MKPTILNYLIALKGWLFFAVFFLISYTAMASGGGGIPSLGPVRFEFILFALTLLGVALFHKRTMHVALIGLASILVFKFAFDANFHFAEHILGSANEEGEWRTLVNLLGLLLGFAILAKHFEESNIPELLPKFLPDDWKGGFVLLIFIFILSAFLDNIAAAIIGGTIAMVVYKGKVHLGYLVAIIAASNAGGAGSVIGDTTTTLMWIDGVSALDVTHAFIASGVALVIFGIFGSLQQDKYNKIQKDETKGIKPDISKLIIVAFILVSAIFANAFLDFPAAGVWFAILVSAIFKSTPWGEMKKSIQGSIFLLSLVMCASLMPVEELPAASWHTAFILGFVSAVFDNIPLTKLCLEQGGYDWGILAYTAGFGGSMIWFGSSAGVAISNIFPETKSVVDYIKKGWYVIPAYIIGFFVMLLVVGWNPHEPHRKNEVTKNNTELLIEPNK